MAARYRRRRHETALNELFSVSFWVFFFYSLHPCRVLLLLVGHWLAAGSVPLRRVCLMGGRRIGGISEGNVAASLLRGSQQWGVLAPGSWSESAEWTRGVAERVEESLFAPLKYLLFQAPCQDVLANRSSRNIQTYINISPTTVIKNL